MLALLSAAGEDFGWRGFLWGRVRASRGFWVTALTVGVIWAAWHLPLLIAYGHNSALVFAAANLVTPDAAFDVAPFRAYTALGWTAWVGIAVGIAAVALRRRAPVTVSRPATE